MKSKLITRLIVFIIIIGCVYFLYDRTIYLVSSHISNKDQQKYSQKILKKIKRFDKLIKSPKTADHIFELAQYYHHGIEIGSTSKKQNIKEIQPGLRKSLKYYSLLLKHPRFYDKCYLNLGDIYNYGNNYGDNLENKAESRRCYLKALTSIDLDVKTKALESLINLNLEEGQPMYKDLIIFNPQSRNNILNQNIPELERAPVNNRIRIPDIIHNNVEVMSDSQNVHDPGVINTLKSKIKQTSTDNLEQLDIQDLISIVKEFNPDEGLTKNYNLKKQTAEKVLNKLYENNRHVSNLNICEKDAIKQVYSKYKRESDPDKKKTLIHNLILNSSECIDSRDNMVCAQGTVSRILNSVHDDVKPLWALRQEMLNKSTKIREEMLKEFDENHIEAINNPQTDVDKNLSDNFSSNLKNKVKQDLHKEYVDTELIRPETFKKELDSWIDFI